MLIPKKHKEILTQFTNENSLDEELVSDITSFYWKKIRQTMTNLEHENVMIQGLGYFKIRESRVSELIKDYIRRSKMINCNTYNNRRMYEDYINEIDNLKAIKQRYDDDMLRLIEHKRKRKEYDEQKTKNNSEQAS